MYTSVETIVMTPLHTSFSTVANGHHDRSTRFADLSRRRRSAAHHFLGEDAVHHVDE